MSLIVNDGGVLRTLGAVSANDGGTVRNLGQISADDGGVIRGVYSSKKCKVEGITPLVSADDHIVITRSGTFTLTAPAGARIIIAGGGQNGQRDSGVDENGYHENAGYGYGSSYVNGGSGGFVAEYTLTSDIKKVSCSVTLGTAMPYNKNANSSTLSASTLKIGSASYSSGSTVQVIQTKWGPVGGNGGKGFYRNSAGGSKPVSTAPDGTGAGGGGGGIRVRPLSYSGSPTDYYGKGGNRSGYGNKGGDGGYNYDGRNGSSGAGGAEYPSNPPDSGVGTSLLGGGGGGGYGAGGGGSSAGESVWYNSNEDSNEYNNNSSFPGSGGAGVVVIEWTN